MMNMTQRTQQAQGGPVPPNVPASIRQRLKNRARAFDEFKVLAEKPSLTEAEQAYTKNAGETVTAGQRRMLARYTRNLALRPSGPTGSAGHTPVRGASY